jgi:hypothetical protein
MASNPPPTDLATAQLVVDEASGNLRPRADDERTAAGAGIEHTKFIYCPALGVRFATRPALHNAQTCTLRPERYLLMRNSARHFCAHHASSQAVCVVLAGLAQEHGGTRT